MQEVARVGDRCVCVCVCLHIHQMDKSMHILCMCRVRHMHLYKSVAAANTNTYIKYLYQYTHTHVQYVCGRLCVCVCVRVHIACLYLGAADPCNARFCCHGKVTCVWLTKKNYRKQPEVTTTLCPLKLSQLELHCVVQKVIRQCWVRCTTESSGIASCVIPL